MVIVHFCRAHKNSILIMKLQLTSLNCNRLVTDCYCLYKSGYILRSNLPIFRANFL